MRSIFEAKNETPFEDMMMGMKEVRSDNMLGRYIIKLLTSPMGRAGFVWQMPGNQVKSAVLDCIDNFNDETDYVCADRMNTPAQILNFDEGTHIYRNQENADNDDTTGLYIFTDFARASQNLIDFVISIVKKNGYYLAKNWRLLMLGDIHSGDEFWKPEYRTIFDCIEYSPKIEVDYYDDNDDMDESKKDTKENDVSEATTSSVDYMTMDEAKDKIYAIIYNAAKMGEINRNEYIYLDEDGVMVDDPSGFTDDMLAYAKPAEMFIDFDALDTGNTIIYTKPLMMFIEDSIKK